ncbi:hypothetical protein DN536_35635 [Burkholderia multivorans]|nr:hypothetical protein DN536_35635 [Burkholderia multivorans]
MSWTVSGVSSNGFSLSLTEAIAIQLSATAWCEAVLPLISCVRFGGSSSCGFCFVNTFQRSTPVRSW